ncbi:MAG TPA: glycoside hydrolase family 19 protein [Pseudonocardiaceae bacterium]
MSIRLALTGLVSIAMAAAASLVVLTTPAAADTACTTAWSSTQVYTSGMEASFNGHNYTAKWWTQNEQPPGTSGVWADDGTCGGGGGTGDCNYPQWVAGTNYVAGDIVQYPANGQYYQASHDNPGYDPTISTWYWSPYTCGGGGTTPPPGGFVVSEAQFDQMFPNRNSFYTYSGLTAAMSAYPGFATTGSDTVQKQEAAAFLANVGHETGGLVYINEIDQSGNYCASESYGCPAGSNQYFGRGPLQISWNFNYYAAGNALGIDLLDNPNLVSTDAATSWKTALWYWDTQSGPGTMTAHNAMVNSAGFGQTIWAINGSIECNGGNTGEMQDRVNLYEQYTQILGVPAGNNLTC